MFSTLKHRIAGLRAQLLAARRTAHEMLELHGDRMWKRFAELEALAWERLAYKEFLFWKLTRAYARELKKVGLTILQNDCSLTTQSECFCFPIGAKLYGPRFVVKR